tara:strand:- start:1595 stop:2104 length:510 start_codon:yes stop_codon:yes gene_type:complete
MLDEDQATSEELQTCFDTLSKIVLNQNSADNMTDVLQTSERLGKKLKLPLPDENKDKDKYVFIVWKFMKENWLKLSFASAALLSSLYLFTTSRTPDVMTQFNPEKLMMTQYPDTTNATQKGFNREYNEMKKNMNWFDYIRDNFFLPTSSLESFPEWVPMHLRRRQLFHR